MKAENRRDLTRLILVGAIGVSAVIGTGLYLEHKAEKDRQKALFNALNLQNNNGSLSVDVPYVTPTIITP